MISGTKPHGSSVGGGFLDPRLNDSLMQIKVNVCAKAAALTRSYQFDFVDVNGLCCNESSIKCVFVQLSQALSPLQINLKAPLPENPLLKEQSGGKWRVICGN